MDYTIAMAQIQPKLGCVAENFQRIEAAVERGIQEHIDLLLFPELALTGYFLKDLVPEVALSLDSDFMARLKKLSQYISLALGFVEVTGTYRLYNSALYLERGDIKHLHRKVYLPTYGLFDEQRYFARGDRFRAFDTKFGRMGLLLCEDMWHMSAPYILALDGATTLLCLASSPGRGLGDGIDLDSTQSWQKLLSTISMVFNSHIVFCNRVGVEDGIVFWGGSEVRDPFGAVSARGVQFDEDFVVARISESMLRRARISSPFMRDEALSVTIDELNRIDQARRR